MSTEQKYRAPQRIEGVEEPELEMKPNLEPVGNPVRLVPEVKKQKPPLCIGVGASGLDLLDHWGAILYEAFGEHAYHVGSSSLQKTGWRDVDVRMIMDDEQFEALFGKYSPGRTNAFWVAMMLAFSLWGEKVTGLPIDFQIQKRSLVPQEDWDKPRNPLGVFPSNVDRPPWHRWQKKDDDEGAA